MISFEQAREIAVAFVGKELVLLDELTLEKPYGWYFMAQSRRWVETRDRSEMLYGSGGFVVERNGSRVVSFGSAHRLEENFSRYENGLLLPHQFFDVQTIFAQERIEPSVSD